MGSHHDRRAADPAQAVADFPGDHLLTTKELAAWLAVHTITIKRWKAAGIGPKATRALRFRKDDVQAWLKKRAV